MSYLVFETNPLVSILFTFAYNLSDTVLLTTSVFTTQLSLLKSTGTVFNFPISILYILAFKQAISDFAANWDGSTLLHFSNLILLPN